MDEAKRKALGMVISMGLYGNLRKQAQERFSNPSQCSILVS